MNTNINKTPEKRLCVSSIFDRVHKIRNALRIGINQDVSRYNEHEKASFLDNFLTYYSSLDLSSRYQQLTNIAQDIGKLKESYGLKRYDFLEQRYTGLSPHEQLETAGLVGEIISPVISVNDNPIPKEELKNKSLLDVLGILGLIQKFSGINSQKREEFIQGLKELDAQGKLGPEVQAEKYKLTLILEIPELSTWEMIFSALELKYPHKQWKEKAA